MTFHVGQKVVAIKTIKTKEASIVDGEIYFVREVFWSSFYRCPMVKLVGQPDLHHPITKGPLGWKSERFRPVQEKGMSILRAIAANPKRELEGV